MTGDRKRRGGGLEYVERTLARAMVVAGSAFWVIAAFVGHYVSRTVSLEESILSALWPFLGTLAALAVGWRNERLASMLLLVAAVAVAVWGVIYSWTSALWVLMGGAVIGPLAIAGVLFALAARAEDGRTAAEDDSGGRPA
jgi:peptidoglycan/LPS O-acetylase OafA/YrhL